MIDWSLLSPEEFERLCADLLELNGFENVDWYGKGGGDKGRDLTAIRYESPLPSVRKAVKWIVQCKRYIKKTLGKDELAAFFNAAREHRPDAALLITTTTLTPDVRDWLKAVQPDYNFEIYTWEERDLERQAGMHRSKLSVDLRIVPKTGEPQLFYPSPDPGRVYLGNAEGALGEVGFFILNSAGPQRDRELLRAFVEYIRHNEIEFYDGEGNEQ
jgi:restriction endonuclease Mrr